MTHQRWSTQAYSCLLMTQITVNNPEQAQLLQDDLHALEEWPNLWQPRFNAENVVMHFGSHTKHIEYHMHKDDWCSTATSVHIVG